MIQHREKASAKRLINLVESDLNQKVGPRTENSFSASSYRDFKSTKHEYTAMTPQKKREETAIGTI